MAVEFFVPGQPVGKGRPRATVRAGRARLYTPARTADAEARADAIATLAMGDSPLMDGPLSLVLDVRCAIPTSWSKKKQAAALAGEVRPTGRPDLDNIVKLYADAFNGVIWRDDSQVVRVVSEKRYSDRPGVLVTVMEVRT